VFCEPKCDGSNILQNSTRPLVLAVLERFPEVVSLACLCGICLRLLQDPKVVAALASYSHTGNGGKARVRKDTDKGGGQRPRGGQRASSSATSAPKTGKVSIQFFGGKRDMAPAPRACSTQSTANARPAEAQYIEEIPSHAAAQAMQQGISGRFWCPLCQSVQELQVIPHSGHECQGCCEFIDVDQ
jgi:hypothetical protein